MLDVTTIDDVFRQTASNHSDAILAYAQQEHLDEPMTMALTLWHSQQLSAELLGASTPEEQYRLLVEDKAYSDSIKEAYAGAPGCFFVMLNIAYDPFLQQEVKDAYQKMTAVLGDRLKVGADDIPRSGSLKH